MTLSNATPPILNDTATLSGAFLPTGTITFKLFAPGVVLPVDTEVVNVNSLGGVNGNRTYTTPNGYTLPTSGPVAGTYQWVVTYSGDDNNNQVASPSGDEPVVVVPATLLISTFPDPSDGTLSDAPLPNLTDTATLTGGFNETGTITFELFGPGGLGNIYTDTQPVTGDGTYTTTFTPPTPDPGTPITGTYGWVVSYSGDDNNNPVASLIGNESGQLHPASPGLSTVTIPPQVTLTSGSPPVLTDTATLSGGFEESGTITFDLFASGGVLPVHTEIVIVSGNGAYTTPVGYTLPTTGTVTGTYQWVATYSGDDNNIGVASARGDEPVVVAPANLLISTTFDPSDVTLSNSPLPPIVTDTATITGSYHATGTITFDLYGPDLTTIVYTDTMVVDGDGAYITTFAAPPPPPGLPIVGTYNWVVSYSGDANNNGVATSFGNESGQVHAANPSLGTNSNPGQVTLTSGNPPILRLGDALGRVRGDRDDHLRSLRPRWRGGDPYRDRHSRGDGTYTTPNGYAAHDRDGGRHLSVGRHIQRRRQQQRRGQRQRR